MRHSRRLLFINSFRSRLLIAPDFCSSKISSGCNLHRCCRGTNELPAHLEFKLQQDAAAGGHGSPRLRPSQSRCHPGPAPRGHHAAPRRNRVRRSLEDPATVRERREEPHADAELAAPRVRQNTPGSYQPVPGGSEHPWHCPRPCCRPEQRPWSPRRAGRLQGHAGTALCKATGFT